MKTRVGISCSLIIDQGGMFPGYKRAYVNNDYVVSVVKAGGLPVMLPLVEELSLVKEYLSNIDCLILSGGHDISPQLYGEEPQQRLSDTFIERDYFDFKLLEEALKQKMPVFGICRGFQLINAYFGGKILQDLSYSDKTLLKHSQGHTPLLATHTVLFQEGSRLYKIFGDKEMTNSFHHQVVKEAGKGLKVVAKATDGVIEAVEAEDYPLFATQWHPEMMSSTNKKNLQLFKELINEANKFRKA